MSKNGISLKGTADFATMAGMLDDLCASFKGKTVCLQKGGEYVTLRPTESISFEIEAERKKSKQKLVIELSWQEETPFEEVAGIKISSTEPAPAEIAPEAPAEGTPEASEAPAATEPVQAPCEVPPSGEEKPLETAPKKGKK